MLVIPTFNKNVMKSYIFKRCTYTFTPPIMCQRKSMHFKNVYIINTFAQSYKMFMTESLILNSTTASHIISIQSRKGRHSAHHSDPINSVLIKQIKYLLGVYKKTLWKQHLLNNKNWSPWIVNITLHCTKMSNGFFKKYLVLVKSEGLTTLKTEDF